MFGKLPLTARLLVGISLLLAACLVLGLTRPSEDERKTTLPADSSQGAKGKPGATAEPGSGTNPVITQPIKTTKTVNSKAAAVTPDTPFGQIYSDDPKRFAANLRAIHCPELTINDILTAEVHRRFQAQEKALQPTPADHVPWSWSARTTEPRLLERREQAASLAREEGAMLRNTLACEATVPVPLYARTSSDDRFEESLAGPASINSCAIRSIQDSYWTEVQALQQRTKGFWLPEDVAELERLKAQRRQMLAGLLPGY